MDGEQQEKFSIAELSARAEVTARTIRYYVAEGLLPSPGGAGQQRLYTSEHLRRLQAIKRLKAEYLPLGEIRERLAALPAGSPAARAPQEPSPRTHALSYIEDLLGAAPAPPLVHAPLGASAAVSTGTSLEQVVPDETPVVVQESRSPTATPGLALRARAARGALPGGAGERRHLHEAVARTDAPPTASIWQRVELVPGVELHYQPSADPTRATAIAKLIGEATHLFSPRSADPAEPTRQEHDHDSDD